MSTKEDYYVPENKIDEETKLSPSGKYKLIVSRYKTKQGYGDISLGEVYKGEEKIATIKRNLCGFHYGFVEDHFNGHDYLLTGENYQGQTVIELDTGKRADYLPEAAKKGWAWCMAGYYASPDRKKIAIEGCHWGGNYEIYIADFTEPMKLPWGMEYYDDIDAIGSMEDWTDEGMIFEKQRPVRLSDGKDLWSLGLSAEGLRKERADKNTGNKIQRFLHKSNSEIVMVEEKIIDRD